MRKWCANMERIIPAWQKNPIFAQFPQHCNRTHTERPENSEHSFLGDCVINFNKPTHPAQNRRWEKRAESLCHCKYDIRFNPFHTKKTSFLNGMAQTKDSQLFIYTSCSLLLFTCRAKFLFITIIIIMPIVVQNSIKSQLLIANEISRRSKRRTTRRRNHFCVDVDRKIINNICYGQYSEWASAHE